VGVLFSIFIGLFQGPLIALLTSQAEVMDTASIYYPYIIIFPIVAVWSFWLDGVFIGANRNAEMMWSMLFASGIVFSGLLFTFQTLLNTGLWLAYLGFIAARGVSLGYISYRYTKRNAWFKSS
jgi:MATE family multidrug resistance protein